MSDPIDPPAPDPELDDRVRAAAGALLGLVPEGQIDGLEAWVLRELTQIDRRGTGAPAPASQSRTENRMMSDREKTPNRVPDVPALKRDGADGKRDGADGKRDGADGKRDGADGKRDGADGVRTEDSGLHDIKALAQDTKKRISRRITSQHDAYDESLLSSSHSGLRAVALPEPARVVSLPDVPTSMAEVRAASSSSASFGGATAATAREGAAVTPITARKRTNLWLGLGAAGVVAAAAAVVIAMSAGGGDNKNQPAAVASADNARTAAGSAVAALPPSEAMGAGSGSSGGAGSAAGAGLAQPATPGDAPGGAAGRARAPESDGAIAGGDKKAPAADKAEVAKVQRGSGSGTDPKPPAATGAAGTAGKVDAAKPPGKGSGAKPPAGAATSGEKSIEDLLNDASGGPAKPKDVATGGGGDTAAAKPEKTGLDTKDIKGGMSAVAGKAQNCFDQHGVAGHVKVRVTIASSGSVTKADATGEFAGTPTGACVASAVKGASFPEWTGSSMTVNYAFTLQE